MRWPRPSLVRRLTIGFVVAQGLALSLFLLALWPFATLDAEDHVGPDVAITFLTNDVVVRGGRLALRDGADIRRLAARSPDLWYLVRAGDAELRHGTVPAPVSRVVRTLPDIFKSAEFKEVGALGRVGDASIATVETAAGSATITAGGVDADAVTLLAWMLYLYRGGYYWVPLITAALTLLGVAAAVPLVLRSVRPTARAAAGLDPGDLDKRLPERGVVKELLPIVRAFNAALDRLAEAFERRRRFIADVAHELRTPLAVLNMHVEALPSGGTKPDLQRTVFRLGQMVGQMLDAERLSLAGRRRERVDLVALGRAAVADAVPLAVGNGYEMAFSAAADEVIVNGDPHAISRAFANLLGNAVAHGGNSGTIEMRVGSAGIVEVADQGPGIPAEARERIFEPFHRERWDRDGCGLGLHLVREVMQAHGGQACVANGGPGAVLRLQFPVAPGAA